MEFAPLKPPEFESLVDCNGVLTIKLRTEKDLLSVCFDSYLLYRKLDEGDALKMLDELASTAPLGRTFYRAYDSELLDWLQEQSLGVKNGKNLEHYLIAASNDWIDVISWTGPKVGVQA
jgi:hypothetical protein